MSANPKRRSDLAWRNIADEAVIVELSADRMFYQLNDVAAFIWNLCDGNRTLAQIEELVLEEYDVSVESAQKDVEGFIGDLSAMKLLE